MVAAVARLADLTRDQMAEDAKSSERIEGEEAIIRVLAPLAAGYPGALGLEDDCALIAPKPGTELVLKTDPVAEGVHFLADDAPEDVAWKALAVNVSDLAAKAAGPLGLPDGAVVPRGAATAWLARFAAGLRAAQAASAATSSAATPTGGRDRSRSPSASSARSRQAAWSAAARRGRAITCSSREPSATPHSGWRCAKTRAGRRLGSRAGRGRAPAAAATSPTTAARPRAGTARACRRRNGFVGRARQGPGAHVQGERLWRPRPAVRPARPGGRRQGARRRPRLGERIATGGDDYEVLAAVPAAKASAFRSDALATGVPVARIGEALSGAGVAIEGPDGRPLDLVRPGWDHF